MNKDPLLKKAKKLIKRKKYTQVVRLLEKEVFTYRESFAFFYLLGLSCLHLKDLSAADSYLKRAVNLDDSKAGPKLGLAYVSLRRRNLDSAIKQYLNILDEFPGNSFVKRALGLIRRQPEPTTLSQYLDKKGIFRLVPSYQNPLVTLFKWTLVAVLITTGLSLGIVSWNAYRAKLIKNARAGIFLEVDSSTSRISSQGDFQIVLTVQEVDKSLKEANTYFQEYKDNLARREINRILISNASENVKAKVSSLKEHLQPSSFANIKHNFSLKETVQNPYLYQDVYVLWKGQAANVEIGSDKINFDFLVGYTEGTILEGVIPVEFEFAIDVKEGVPLELLAQIQPTEEGLLLRGVGIHQLLNP